jgi:branched-chain amino acid transport system substrate-binding protein
MTGANATFGVVSEQGVELAVKDINDQGGIKSLGGAKLVLEKGDAQSDPTVTAAEVERIASEGDISAFVGVQASALTLAATEVSERYKIPFVTYSIADKLVQRGFKYIFLICPLTSTYGAAPVDFVEMEDKASSLPSPKVGIAYEEGPTGSSTAVGMRDEAKKVGEDIVLDESYPAGFTDASPLILKVKQSGATILYLASSLTDAVLIQRTLKEQAVNVTIVGNGVGHTMNEFGTTLGKDADYVYVAESSDRDMKYPGLAEMGAEYQKTYGALLSPQALGSYTLVWIIKDALEAAGSRDPEAVRNALAGIDITSGPGAWNMGGRVKFNDVGLNTYGQLGMFMWKDGLLHAVWPAAAATVQLVWPAPAWSNR